MGMYVVGRVVVRRPLVISGLLTLSSSYGVTTLMGRGRWYDGGKLKGRVGISL